MLLLIITIHYCVFFFAFRIQTLRLFVPYYFRNQIVLILRRNKISSHTYPYHFVTAMRDADKSVENKNKNKTVRCIVSVISCFVFVYIMILRSEII